MLQSDNITLLQKEIRETDLPNSFRDTFVTCRRMGVQYLWIDSLCIIQSGTEAKEDWLKELGAMETVYTNSLFTISIDRAENAHQGAFVSRDPSIVQACHVYGMLRSEQENTLHAVILTVWADRDSIKSLDEQPLAQRAWTFQERILSPRLLRFGPDRIWWECNENCCNEYLDKGNSRIVSSQNMKDDSKRSYENRSGCIFTIPKIALRSAGSIHSIQDLKDHRHVLGAWMKAREDYSIRTLTRVQDKLPAIGGVASKFGAYFDHDYLAGLFRKELPFGLLWMTVEPNSRQDHYRAPTWSWASINRKVSMTLQEGYLRNGNECNHCAILEEVRVDLVDKNNRYGPVRDAELRFNGILLKCTFDAEKEKLITWVPVLKDVDLGASMRVLMDEKPWSAGARQSRGFFVFPLVEGTYRRWSYASTWEYNGGLILECTDQSDVFRRVGCYRGSAKFWKHYIERGEQPQTVRII
ncbi:hypothetical protein N8I77_005649 [Diaporthe amygdali]|uniref:Heterokaryon incompatibility domain-containing protein n=1 Tax=Phomopsis amygdali TaxID=1214568 RepID=A0AAD9SGC7_PHOAM|nr:hypothetical protein N8I77_005649 [Diaporthe amygdali]